jgi:hypothetical protein
MNFQICLAIIYSNIGIYTWRPFYRTFKQNTQLNLEKSFIEENERNDTSYLNNLKNHTFMDDEEFMKLLRFYRPN